MKKTRFFDRIKQMIRKTKMCYFLNKYIETRPLEPYPVGDRQGLRLGILNSEQKEFVKYLQQQKGFTNDSEIKIFDDIKDAHKYDYLEHAKIDVSGYEQEVLRLGAKGRRLVNGSLINRSVYFIEFAFSDTPYLVGLVGGIGILTLVFLLLQQIFIWLYVTIFVWLATIS